MPLKTITKFLLVMSFILMFLINYTIFSQNQIHILKNYQHAYQDYKNNDYILKDQVYSFENSFIKVSTLKGDYENAIVFGDTNFTIYNNSKSTNVNYVDYQITNISTLFSNYLVNYYSLYTSIFMILLIGLKTLWILLLLVTFLYIVKRVYKHTKKRNESYINITTFKQDIYKIATTLFIVSFISAYTSLLIGGLISLINMIILAIIIYAIQLKSKRSIL